MRFPVACKINKSGLLWIEQQSVGSGARMSCKACHDQVSLQYVCNEEMPRPRGVERPGLK